MHRLVWTSSLLGLLLITPRAWGQIPVTDVAAAAQRTVQLVNQGLAYVRQGEQIINEYNQIRNQITQIAHQVANLQRIPQGLNFMQDISLYGSKVTGLLGQANALSFELDHSARQFDDLYRQAHAITTPAGMLALRQQMLQARLQTAGMSVQMQSVKTNLTDIYARLCALLGGSDTASGNLDSHQLAAQQQALQVHTQQTMLAMQAANARLVSQQQAEEIVLQQQALAFYTTATTLAPVGDWRNGPQLEMRVRGSLQ
jgi:P-type conjugative transfer protein TrbJ